MSDKLKQEIYKNQLAANRRTFLKTAGAGLGSLALGSLFGQEAFASVPDENSLKGVLEAAHLAPKAKRIIYLFQAGGPSQFESFEYKPELEKRHGEEIPPSVKGQQQVSGMVKSQSTFPLIKPSFDFSQHGESGAWVSELFPHTASIVDEITFIKSMQTDQINHAPAVNFIQSGFPLAGRPSIGSWLSYGLGTDNNNLPNFVVLVSKSQWAQPLNSSAWSNGFLPSRHQGVMFRSGKDPVLYLNSPDGVARSERRSAIDMISALNREQNKVWVDPEVNSKISQYEMAFRMQMSVPDAVDFSDEPASTFDLYGEDARRPGSFAANCLMARRLAERNVKFIQLYHSGWDQHGNLPEQISQQAAATDQASAALIKDLKQRGMLEDTLVVWGGEFGRTAFSQGKYTPENYGRDHHKGAFTYWMAGGGVKAGHTHGETDEFSYNVVKDPVHVHDLQATMMHLAGIDHERLKFKYQGRRFRLTDVHGHVVKDILV